MENKLVVSSNLPAPEKERHANRNKEPNVSSIGLHVLDYNALRLKHIFFFSDRIRVQVR